MRRVLFFVSLLLLCSIRALYAQGVDESKVITLTVRQGEQITFVFAGSTQGVRVRIDGVDNGAKELEAPTFRTIDWKNLPRYKALGTEIKIYGNITLFACDDNGQNITGLDITTNPEITMLSCVSNQLRSLDVSNNLGLRELFCSSNELNTLDISHNPELKVLSCSDNQLTSLDISKNMQLAKLWIYGNRFTISTLNDLYAQLPDMTNKTGIGIVYLSNDIINTTTSMSTALLASNMSVAKNKMWFIKDWNNSNAFSLEQGAKLPDRTKVITFKVKEGEEINFSFAAEKQGEPVLIEGIENAVLTTAPTELKSSFGANNVCKTNRSEVTITGAITKLRLLDNGGELITFDVTRNSALKELYCNHDVETAPDLSKSTSLETLFCVGSNWQLPKELPLKKLICRYRESLDVSGFKNLVELDCSNNSLSALDVTELVNLRVLNCAKNQLSALDLSQNKALIELNCAKNHLRTLELRQANALTKLDCSENQLTVLNLTQSKALVTLNCSNNQLTTLDLTQSSALKEIDCYRNKLITLDFSNNLQLEEACIYRNEFTTATLDKLYCSLPNRVGKGKKGTLNPLFEIEDDKETAIVKATNTRNATKRGWDLRPSFSSYIRTIEGTGALPCGNGKVHVDKTKCITLRVKPSEDITLAFTSPIPNTSVLIEGLEGGDRYVMAQKTQSYSSNRPKYRATDITIKVYGAVTGFDCSKNHGNLLGLDLSKNPALTELICDENTLYDLDLSRNPAITHLYCSKNKISKLDVSKLRRLQVLTCDNNNLDQLDLTKNPNLKILSCENNHLKSLILTQNPALESLNCDHNGLTKLDLRRNLHLHDVSCSRNMLTELDVTKNLALKDLDCGQNNLTKLNMGKNLKLCSLYCEENDLTQLTIPKTSSLVQISLYGNEFSTTDLDNIYDQLPSGSSNINSVIYLLRNHNDRNKFKVDNSNTRRLRSKNWRWLYGDDRDNVVIEHNTPTRTPRE